MNQVRIFVPICTKSLKFASQKLSTHSFRSHGLIRRNESPFSRCYHLSPLLYITSNNSGSKPPSPSSDVPQPGGPLDKVNATVVPKIKTSVKYDDSMKSVKFITPLRAMRQFMLTAIEMEKLPKYYSRSPYSYETKTLVYKRADVEQTAFAKHGNQETFKMRQKIAMEMERKQKIDIFNIKRALKYFQKVTDHSVPHRTLAQKVKNLYSTGGGRVVLYAIGVNGFNCIAKAIAWWYTGSKSMFSEFMHSLADTLNQIILAVGLQASLQKPDDTHPYGYLSVRNVSSLISGVGIFFLGSGLSVYQGIMGLMQNEEVGSMYWGLFLLTGSLLSEGATLLVAVNHAREQAAKAKMSFKEYVLESADPTTNVVLLEDLAAVSGVCVAGSCMFLSSVTGSRIPDAVGALIIGSMLAGVASFIVSTNIHALIGKSIPSHKKEEIMRVLESSKIIRGTYDIKATVIGGDSVRFKAEVDVDGAELTKRYLETVPLDQLLREIQSIQSQEEAVHFMLKHGDNVVNVLGAEINKIEESIKKEYPSVKHIDIEIN